MFYINEGKVGKQSFVTPSPGTKALLRNIVQRQSLSKKSYRYGSIIVNGLKTHSYLSVYTWF